jgi:hypothetical protein
MRELSHSDQILKQLKSQRSTGKKMSMHDVNMTSPKLINDVDVVETCGSTATVDWADDRSNQNWTRGM